MTIIAGAENIRRFTVLQVVHALALEVGTGMKISSRMSALQAAKLQRVVPETCRSKKAALKLAVEYMKGIDPEYEPKGSVALALKK
jgi:hypothetical protein